MVDSNIKWQDLKHRIRQFNKTASESSNFQLPHFFKFSSIGDTGKLYFLGVPTGQTHFTLLHVTLSDKETAQGNGHKSLPWKQCWSTDAQPKSNKPLNREQELLRERMRVRTSGIMSYNKTEHFSVEGFKFTQFLFLSGSQLYVFRDYNTKDESLPTELTLASDGCILNPMTCPSNPNLICFVQDGDIYVKLGLSEEVRLTFLRSAPPGANCFSAGMPSYVVQEEFDRYVGYWWRPVARNGDSSNCYYILYEEVDESQVDILSIVSYNTPGSTVDQYRYPRPGTTNALSDLKIVEFTCKDSKIFNVRHLHLEKPLRSLFPDMEYLLNAGWLPDGMSIYVEMTNRKQSIKRLFMIPLEKFYCPLTPNPMEPMETNEIERSYYLLKEETSDYWIHTNELLHFLPSPSPQNILFLAGSESSGFLHIHRYSVDLSETAPCPSYKDVFFSTHSIDVPLTSGEWEVSSRQVWVDGKSRLIYFMGYKDIPLESHLYVTSYDQPQTIKEPIRLTTLGYSHTVEMDEECSYYVTLFSSVSEPHASEVHSIHVDTKSGKVFTEKIGLLLNPVTNKSLLMAELFKYDSTCGSTFYGMVFRPDPIEVSMVDKFPVILHVYGGPHVQHVSNSYTVNRHLISHKLAHFGFSVVIIDGRGSARRGVEFEGHLKKNLGQVELDDQIETLQWLSGKFPFLDMSRVGIMGWSYGGYLSLMGIACKPDIFKVAVSGAPVTSWQLYDTAYTERFMGLPDEDPEAYLRSSVVELASKFPDEEGRLLIIHGLMDENVHFYHTSSLVNALIKASKPYILQTYPKERHGIRSHDAHDHYVTVVLNFLIKNL